MISTDMKMTDTSLNCLVSQRYELDAICFPRVILYIFFLFWLIYGGLRFGGLGLGCYIGFLRFSVFGVWGLWYGAFWVFWVGALYISIKE